MSSRRTRKKRGSNRSNRSRTQRSLNPSASIFGPQKKGYLEPIKNAKELADEAERRINEGNKSPKPTGKKELTNAQKKRLKSLQIRERIKIKKSQRQNELAQQNQKLIDEVGKENDKIRKIQREYKPKPPSQPPKKQSRPQPRRRKIEKEREEPKTSSPSKSKSNTQSRRTILPKPPSKSQKKGQGSSRPQPRKTLRRNRTILTNSQNPQGNRRSERLKDKRN